MLITTLQEVLRLLSKIKLICNKTVSWQLPILCKYFIPILKDVFLFFFGKNLKKLKIMQEYILSAKVTISVYTRVEAESLEDAIEIAGDRDLMSVVTNNGECESDTWICDELDGVPYDIIDSEA